MDETPWWKRKPSAGTVQPAKRVSLRQLLHGSQRDGETAPKPEVASQDPDESDGRISSGRLWFLLATFLVVVVIITVRMAYWAVASPAPGPSRGAAAAELIRSRIVDRNGLLLATDSFYWEVNANPKAVRNDKDSQSLATDLARILGQPEAAIRASLAVTGSYTMLDKHADEEQRKAIEELKKPTSMIWMDEKRGRAYPLGTLGSHVIGFVNHARLGLYGIESSYDAWLMGQRELAEEQKVKKPGALTDSASLYLPSRGRHDLILNVDAGLQHIVEKHLAEAVATYDADGGSIVVMDPRNGAILALANYPSFDPNRYSDVRMERWINAAISTAYEPGSVFKLVTMAAALDAGEITPDSIYPDSGELAIDGRIINNADKKRYGNVTVRTALAKSINVITARICLDLGAETFYRYVRQFGFGAPTEVDLSAEVNGEVKEPGHIYWSRFDLATNSFGQALSVTSIQMINAVATIANGGTRYQPQVAKALVRNGQVYNLPPHILGYPIKPETARTLTQMMVYTVDSSSYSKFMPGYRVAGKTGTAEISTAKGYTQDTIMSFVGFLPAADPQLVILVKIEKPKRGGLWAEQVAVPVWAKVAQDSVRNLRIAPDDRMP
jgi:cell division protein FtsI/penicillin-binding protein 2